MPTAIPEDAQCLNCRYFLRDLTLNRCPECGQAFDPADPATMRLNRKTDWANSVLLRPFGKATNRLAIAATILILAAPILSFLDSSDGAVLICDIFWIGGKLLWIAVVARWMTRLLFRLALGAICLMPAHRLPGGWRRFAVAPLLLLILIFLPWSSIITRTAVILDYPFLQHAAGDPAILGTNNCWIGFINAHRVERMSVGIQFECGDGILAYSDITTLDDRWIGCSHVIGDWYHVSSTREPDSLRNSPYLPIVSLQLAPAWNSWW